MLHGLQSKKDQIFQVYTRSHIFSFFLITITRDPINPYSLLSFSPPSFTSFTIPSFSLLVPVQPLSPSLIPRPFLQHTHTHCPFQSPSSSRSRSPSLKGRYYIFQSVLCMIWGVDEAISRSPPRPLPPSCFSPCCLMFQFGGSKHSIRQINCLMHVISQTVYKRGTLCLSPHPHTHTHTPQHRTLLLCPSHSQDYCGPCRHCLL